MSPEDYYNEESEQELMKLDALFENLLYPPNLIQQFETLEEFKEWTETGTIEDIDEMRKEFEPHELYDHLIIIRDIIKQKKIDELLN